MALRYEFLCNGCLQIAHGDANVPPVPWFTLVNRRYPFPSDSVNPIAYPAYEHYCSVTCLAVAVDTLRERAEARRVYDERQAEQRRKRLSAKTPTPPL